MKHVCSICLKEHEPGEKHLCDGCGSTFSKYSGVPPVRVLSCAKPERKET